MSNLPDVLIDEGAGYGWIGGGRTRGQAVSRFMEGLVNAGYAVRFTDFRAHRVFGRLVPRGPSTKGWETTQHPTQFLETCERSDSGAEPYWEVDFA